MPSTILIDDPVECPEAELPWVRSLIAVCRFTFATQGNLGGRPVIESPHSYVRRDWLPADRLADFDRLLELIRRHGFRGRFLATTYVYLRVPDSNGTVYRYWESPSAFAPIVPILNRADEARSPMQPPPPTQLRLEG